MRIVRVVSVLAFTGVVLVLGYVGVRFSRYNVDVRTLEREKAELQEYVRRLSASRRVAQVTVLEPPPDADSAPRTRLRWQETGTDGLVGPPIDVEVAGTFVYFEALVLKFEYDWVAQGDPQRGASLALFRRVFGERQTPESAPSLDPASLSGGYRHEPSPYEKRLWALFWDFVERPELAAEYGVRVAQCEAPAVPVRPGQVWEVNLDAAGGLNVRKVSETDSTAHVAAAAP